MKIFQYNHKHNSTDLCRAKTLVVMGGTGTGKTTLLNSYINYLMGIQYTDEFRYRLIDESNQERQRVRG